MDDGGLAVVRLKPLGAGDGGGETSATSDPSVRTEVSYTLATPNVITLAGRSWKYARHIIEPASTVSLIFICDCYFVLSSKTSKARCIRCIHNRKIIFP